ncbi:hypothetical protein HNY73_006030 [Argiope bruennichi]|uniref:MULE transposase domain-containing protein n=1 Tax=Argiope bruennichi TaxID=94029 RepID=A0A8T0FJJ6_ARGBR|nr:hypothetical protein HNY73_006030 [Argiope bruennichi]
MLHNVHQVSKHVKESKNTGCPAVLKITIQRYFSLPKHKDPLPEVIEFPALCELLYLHNHLLDSAAVKKCSWWNTYGCIITNAEETNIFREGVKLLSECFPEKCCLLQNGPLIVMTDDDLKEREVLSEIWPNSDYLLCQFHVLKAVWRWLMDNENKILKEHRQELYFSFKSLMYAAETEMQLKEFASNMLENSNSQEI